MIIFQTPLEEDGNKVVSMKTNQTIKQGRTSRSKCPTTEKTFAINCRINPEMSLADMPCGWTGMSLQSITLSLEYPSVSSRSKLYFCCLNTRPVLILINLFWWAASSLIRPAATNKLNSSELLRMVVSTSPALTISFTRPAILCHLVSSVTGSV